MECSAQQGNTTGGNRALMEEWQSKQNAVKQEIYDKLKKEGKLPRNGRIEFEARVKTDPKSKDKVQLEIENVRVIDENQGKSITEVPARGKGGTGGSYAVGGTIRMPEVELRNIELKGGEFLRDYIEIRDIDLPGGPAVIKDNVSKPVEVSKAPEEAPQAAKPAPPAEPEQKSWWKRLFGL
jgi:hypothetical protein